MEKRVTKNIFDLLVGPTGNKFKAINFETVVDFIEELFNYYAGINVISESKNIQSFIDLKSLADYLFDFEVTNKTASTYTFLLETSSTSPGQSLFPNLKRIARDFTNKKEPHRV